ncbi:phosphopantetheine-binding protein [Streptomyces sp. TG1A-8]|uniref:phosphopantetheine-binding protein n=1 Tax=Streptomyces sp. TG1A-8 TaxID=3051385 RepID=UPI00265B7D82|nr:phosphopantetheine-binding protein [Streptomyces sp. TG1A-8]MDO0928877.1 phosphopantetheine-binding protein [Streptomyces sp. TG1A-8]
MDSLMTSVARAVRHRAGSDTPAADLDPDTELSALGLTSLGVAGLLVDLEAAFDVRFPADAVTPEVFRTLATLTETVRALRAASEERPGTPSAQR